MPAAALCAEPLHQVMSELATAARTGARPETGLAVRLRAPLTPKSPDTDPLGQSDRAVFDTVIRSLEDLASAIGDQRVPAGRHMADA
ncbi:hypothetical protein [Streptomyces sp. LaPpAH-108]|uniref:hypothetical protein n=1 Tax=Streptomyces sp. LaPpAH-108 TaxID=1155714 RepID=UPI00037CD616|nr:hypothetical protein [Streptomyces sp. LaPpAH-108]